MLDPDEDVWVRRHIPATLALIPGQKTVDVLTAALADPDGFLRYKAVSALERLRRSDAPFAFPRPPVEKLAMEEGRDYFNYLSLHYNLFDEHDRLDMRVSWDHRVLDGATVARALVDMEAILNREILREVSETSTSDCRVGRGI